MVDPAHTVFAPLTVPAFGRMITVIFADALAVPQGVVTVYVKVALPGDTPVTKPDDASIVADAELLLQVPPLRPSLV